MTPITARKRIVTIVIEAFQNALKHGIGPPLLLLQKDQDQYSIYTENRIPTHDRDLIAERLSRINALDDDQLRLAYREGLKQPRNGENCGLGLITMRRKSGSCLEFNFREIDTLHTYFYLRIRVTNPDRS